MIFLWLAVFTTFIWLDRLHSFGVRSDALESAFRLYRLRDELREAAANGRINPKSWVFLYLDSSISKTISILDNLTIWRAVSIRLVQGSSEKSIRAQQHLSRELSKTDNQALAEFYERYYTLLLSFFLVRHPTLRICTAGMIQAVKLGAAIQQRTKDAIGFLRAAPEEGGKPDKERLT